MALFARRARPAPAQRRRGESPEAEEAAPVPQAGGGARRKLLTLDEEDDGEGFQVKKSKLSRQLAKSVRTGGAAAAAAVLDKALGPRRGITSATSARGRLGSSKEDLEKALGSSEDEAEVVEVEPAEVFPGEAAAAAAPAEEADEESDGSVDAARAGEQARLARAQRAAARELGGRGGATAGFNQADYMPMTKDVKGVTTGVERSSPFEPAAAGDVSAAAAVPRRRALPHEEEEDLGEDWAMQQMRVGAHRRHGGVPLDLGEEVMARGPRPAAERDGPAPREAVRLGMGGSTGGGSAASGATPAPRRVDKVQTPSPAEALEKLLAKVKSIEEGERDRVGRGKDLTENCVDARAHLDRLGKSSEQLERGLKTAQQLHEYAHCLAGLLDAKVPKLQQATDMLGQMEREFVARRTKRRRRHLVRVLRGAGATLSAAGEDDAEAEGEEVPEAAPRRSGRREGWDSSSESEAAAELAEDRAAFCSAAHRQLEADVSEEFSASAALLEPLKGAKRGLDKGEYGQAFVPQSLPEALSLHVGHSLLWWDPLRLCPQGDKSTRWGPRRPIAAAQLQDFEWFERLSDFTELQGDDDPDAELVPQLVQRCVFPEVARRLRDCWDVSSAPQSRRVVALLDECLLFDTEESSSSSFSGLVEAAVERLERGLAELAPEVFVAAPDMDRWYKSDARWRLLWRTCKIASCASQLEGRVPDARLAPLVVGAAFGVRIAPHLRGPRLDPSEMDLVEHFVELLPERWLANGLPPTLAALRDALGPRAPRSAAAAATAAQAARVLRRLRCFDEAQALETALP